MPGFNISGNNGPSAKTPSGGNRDWLRSHRFRLIKLFDEDVRFGNDLIYLKDVTIPSKSVADLKITTPGTTYKFAKSADYSDLKLTFYGTEASYRKLLEMADNEKGEGPHSLGEGLGDYHKYKGEITFRLYSVGMEGVTTRRVFIPEDGAGIEYTFSNAWIADVSVGQVSYGSNDLKEIEVIIKIDYYTTKIIDGDDITTNPGS